MGEYLQATRLVNLEAPAVQETTARVGRDTGERLALVQSTPRTVALSTLFALAPSFSKLHFVH